MRLQYSAVLAHSISALAALPLIKIGAQNENESGLNAAAHHFFDDVPQGASFDVLRDEVEPLVLIKNPDELQNVGVVQAAHHLHLGERSTWFYWG